VPSSQGNPSAVSVQRNFYEWLPAKRAGAMDVFRERRRSADVPSEETPKKETSSAVSSAPSESDIDSTKHSSAASLTERNGSANEARAAKTQTPSQGENVSHATPSSFPFGSVPHAG
jgi:hypothetical protein